MIRVKFKKSMPLKVLKRLRNRARIRKRVYGTSESPRLSVFKSSRHIYAQVINDETGQTLFSSSSLKIKEKLKPVDVAKKVGEDVAKKALSKKKSVVVFDRGGFIYHGRVKALADAARTAGLKF